MTAAMMRRLFNRYPILSSLIIVSCVDVQGWVGPERGMHGYNSVLFKVLILNTA